MEEEYSTVMHKSDYRQHVDSNTLEDHVDSLREQYREALFDDVIPWWMRHSLDSEHGGYYSQIELRGQPYSTDKFVWMNARQVWMFSHLYNSHETNPDWLNAATMGAQFLITHAFKPDGKMHFRLTRDGESRSEVLNLYTKVFAAIAFAEYSQATASPESWAQAMKLYDTLMQGLGKPSDTPMLGYPLHGEFHLHAHDMCRITVAWVFNKIQPQKRFNDDLMLSVDSIIGRHWKPQLGVLLENVAMDGSPQLDIPEGRMFHPGHSIESAWMLMEIALEWSDEPLFQTATDIMLASLEQGWDTRYGGIRYLTNIDWTPLHNLEADLKLWWPHCEALYATLLAWSKTSRDDVATWYKKIHQYTFSNFPDRINGEWYGYLNRDGSPLWTAKANGWKGCFHLPRALMRCYQLLR